MILSVTPNTAIDYTMRVPEFSLGRTIRSLENAWGMGGKAADAAWILGHWGEANLAMGFAAGSNGHKMETMLRDRGCQTDFVWVEGETRLNTVICLEAKHSTFTCSTLEVLPEHISAFFEKYRRALDDAACVIVGGTLPYGVPLSFFAEVIQSARQRQIPVIFDSSGLSLKSGLLAYPTVVKPNIHELEELAGVVLSQVEENNFTSQKQRVYTLAQQVQAQYGVSLIVTLGSEGAVALFGESHYWIPSLKVDVVSAAGAGDAVLAGLAVAYAHRQPIEDGLRLGFALATSVLLTLGTADYHPETARSFLPFVELQPLNKTQPAGEASPTSKPSENGLGV